MACGRSVFLVAAFMLAAGAAAQNCQYSYSTCGVSGTYIASLKGSSNAMDQAFVSAATKSAACNGRTTESTCMSDTTNVCSWNATNLPACDSDSLVGEALGCILAPTGPVCEWLIAAGLYCSGVTTQSSCNAKPGCAYQGGKCDVAPGKNMLVAANVAKSQGSNYADRILAVETSCNAYGSGTACTSAKVNGASAVVRAENVVMALLAAMLVLLLL